MEGNIAERRQSSAVPPPWLEPKQQPYTNIFTATPENPVRITVTAPKFDEGAMLAPVSNTSTSIKIQDRHDCK